MIAGYVRLSRDEDKKGYVSIENQKRIILKYAESHSMPIDRWYEDYKESGYSFDRTAYQQLMEALETDVDIIIVKDLSRFGRHNAKVLMYLEMIKEMGKRIIAIDDDYDSNEDENEILGIKTWYNERYIKDTSKKIRRVLSVRQEEGSIIIHVPFGYERNAKNKLQIDPIEEQAKVIRYIFDLYINGSGFRKIADILASFNVPTPSQMIKRHNESYGIMSCRKTAAKWTAAMVKNIVQNDFYIGTLRTRKRKRMTINGRERKVKLEEQLVFHKNHEGIIEEHIFHLAESILDDRKKTSYRGQKNHVNLFGGCLFCSSCGSRLTAINREGKERYYICSSYNKKGKRFCKHSHMIKESMLLDALTEYLKYYRNKYYEPIRQLEMNKPLKEMLTFEDPLKLLTLDLNRYRETLKQILLQKIEMPEPLGSDNNTRIIYNTLTEMETELLIQIQEIELKVDNYIKENGILPTAERRNPVESATTSEPLAIFDELLRTRNFLRKDIELLIHTIMVHADGSFEIQFKFGSTFDT